MSEPDCSHPRHDLEGEIAWSEDALARLVREEAALRAHLGELRRRAAGSSGATAARDPGPSAPAAARSPLSPHEKIRLFRSLFRGRDDVFPRLWVNAKSGRTGYAPACRNEWVAGVCEKPRVKCGECPHQAFFPVDDHAIEDHLRGRHVIGVYPLLADDRCRLLALDFDEGGWREDVAAFVETCSDFGLAPAIERSRSGNGAHAWFFFEGAVPAATARRVGCFLITETMARRPELEMDSYDRLFPNQDTMPAGGFGNLIALPLQYQSRLDGNTVFLDGAGEPFADQWAFLSEVPRVSMSRLEEISSEASRRGGVIGVRPPPATDGSDEEPWRAPVGRRDAPIPGPLPERVRAVLAQRLFVEEQGLPAALRNRIQRLAAFQNPEFYKRQSMRLSTALTPRVISCVERTAHHIGLPRGCRSALESLLSGHRIGLDFIDERNEGESLEVAFRGELSSAQESAVRDLIGHETGVFVAPPGTGKTVVGAWLIAARARSALVLVHRTQLLDQWHAQLANFLGIDGREVGRIGGGRREATGRIDVAMIQSLVRKGEVDERVRGYGHVVVDECHHVPAVSFERVLAEVRARFVVGLTATPQRRDGHHPIIEFQLGPVRHRIGHGESSTGEAIRRRVVVHETGWLPPEPPEHAEDREPQSIPALYARMARDDARNEMIIDEILCALEEGRSPIVLTERRDHLELLAERLRPAAKNLIVLRGGMGARSRREVQERWAAVPETEERLLLATGRFIGEGFDDARLDTLFLAMPVAWRGTLVQYAGRLHRRFRTKTDVRIHDFVDRGVPVLARMFEKRLAGYRAMGYEVDRA